MYRIPLDYQTDSTELFEKLRHLPWPAFLDSGRPRSTQGRFDILCADPVCRVISHGSRCWREQPDGSRQPLDGSPFQALQSVLLAEGLGDCPPQDSELPFDGGALGYFSYDLGRNLERLPQQAENDIDLPEMQVGIYRWAVITDHQQQQSWLIYRDQQQRPAMELLATHLQDPGPGPDATREPFRLGSAFRSNLSFDEYRQRFNRIIDYINAGDCYQVNLAQRFSAETCGDSWQAYRWLRQQAPTPFSAFLQLNDAELLSLSPERFIRVRELQVETKPIKGTRPRGATPEQDQRLAQALAASPKDRAENLMIVDLLRNDLGRTCSTGSIRVPKLFDIESYANVHHLVTTITGALNSTADCLPLLEGSFPGGSITGAPKVRAMEIIEELEPHRRSAYCGSVGYIGFNGNVDTSICIRTLVARQNRLHCWAGGGIVADSRCEEEYQETFDKVSNLIGPLEKAFGGPSSAESGATRLATTAQPR